MPELTHARKDCIVQRRTHRTRGHNSPLLPTLSGAASTRRRCERRGTSPRAGTLPPTPRHTDQVGGQAGPGVRTHNPPLAAQKGTILRSQSPVSPTQQRSKPPTHTPTAGHEIMSAAPEELRAQGSQSPCLHGCSGVDAGIRFRRAPRPTND